MKRITYMSRFSRHLSRADIHEIRAYSAQRNVVDGITGVLVTVGSVFFQIIEGDETAIEALYARVLRDDRHTGVICLQTEELIADRLFPDWSMNVIDLDDATDDVVVPLRLLLSRLGDAQQIIGHYTQPAVSRIMSQGLNPLEVPLRKLDRVVLFTDMVSFSALSHRLPLEAVSELVGTYLETCSIIISNHGGEVTKFLGDGVMAYFDVASVDAAIQSCLDMQADLARVRATAPPHSALRMLFSGFGLALGPVIEGTLGSSIKADYTIIGEPVNTAARVEALTRALHIPILLTSDVTDAAGDEWAFAEAGAFDLGADTPTIVHSLASPANARQDLRALVASHLAEHPGPDD